MVSIFSFNSVFNKKRYFLKKQNKRISKYVGVRDLVIDQTVLRTTTTHQYMKMFHVIW